MSVTFDQIIGPRSTWEKPGSYRAHHRHKIYQNFRYNEIPTALTRGTRKWIKYDAAGSATGAGGTGAQNVPYLVRHMADAKAVVANIIALLGSDVGVLFFPDDVIPGAVANTDQSLVAWGANISFGRDGGGTRKPELSGFVNVAGAVVAAGVATYTHGGGISCYWVRGRLSGSTSRDDYKLQPYTLATTHAQMLANPYTFYPVAGTTEVNYGSHDPTKLELTFNTGAGISCGNYDQIRINGLIVEGFGMHQPGAAGGGQCIKMSPVGTQAHCVTECDCHWGPYHTVGMFNGGGTDQGGICTWHNCTMGYHQWDSGGTGDACVNFCYQGGHEYGLYSCSQTYGGLQSLGAGTRNPQTPYAHSHDDVLYPLSYIAEIDCSWIVDTGVLTVTNAMSPSVPAVTNKDLQTSYRMYTYNRTAYVNNGGLAPATLTGIHDRATTQTTFDAYGSFAYIFGTTSPLVGLWFNSEFLAIATGVWTSSFRLFGTSTASDHRFIHCRLRFVGTAVGIAWTWSGTQLGTCSYENTVVSVESGVSTGSIDITTSPFTNHMRKSDPRAAAGGLSGLAYFGLPSTQVAALPGLVALGAAATWTTAIGVAATCKNAAQPLPTGIACEMDYTGAYRSPIPALHAIGTIEANPVAGLGYGNTGRIQRIKRVTRLMRRRS